METVTPVNESYGLFSDYPTSFKRWFFKGYRSSLKGLTLEHVLQGTTKQPISLYDFRMYLSKKEHTAENLEFHYWYQDYKKRFAALPQDQKSRSPPPKEPITPEFNKVLERGSDYELKRSYANNEQPFRSEVDIVLKTYFHIDSLKELYVHDHVLKYTLYYGAETTHPDVFEAAYQQTYHFMATTSFHNFIHVAVQNIRYPAIVGILTVGCICLALIPMTLFNTFVAHARRCSRAIIFGFAFMFFTCLLSGRTGTCMMRAMIKKRQVPDYMDGEYIKKKASKQNNTRVEADHQDIENNKPYEKSLTPVLDYEVVKYSRQMVFHIITFSLLVALIVGVVVVSITNENDPLPMPPSSKNSTVPTN